MERVSEPFERSFEGLRFQLTRELQPLTRTFFRDLPAADAATIAALVGNGNMVGLQLHRRPRGEARLRLPPAGIST
jgi:hypothetical protein